MSDRLQRQPVNRRSPGYDIALNMTRYCQYDLSLTDWGDQYKNAGLLGESNPDGWRPTNSEMLIQLIVLPIPSRHAKLMIPFYAFVKNMNERSFQGGISIFSFN